MEYLEDEICPDCGHGSSSHFDPWGYGCDECPAEECAPEIGIMKVEA